MEDPVEMKVSRKIKMNFHLMQLDTFWSMQLNASSQLAKAALKVLVSFPTNPVTYVKAVSQLSYTSKARPGIFQSPMKTCAWRPQTKSLTASWSLKKQQKSHVWLLVYFSVNSLYCYIVAMKLF